MSKVFSADEIELGTAAPVSLLSGTADPTAGGGIARAIGSLYARSLAGNASLSLKTTASSTGWTKLAQSLAWKSILDYGAIGDNATDNTAAIQQALNDVNALGGGVVYVPPGIYRVTQLSLSGMTGVQMWGAGAGSIIRWAWNAATAAGSMVTVTANARACVFDSIRFDGSVLTNPAASRNNHLLLLDGTGGGVVETHIENCTFGGMVAASGDGVHVVGTGGNLVSRVWIHDNEFDGCSRFSIGSTQGWQYGWILSNFLTNCETEIAIVSDVSVNTDSIQIQENQIVHTSGSVRHALRFEGDVTLLITRLICAKNIVFGGFVSISNVQFGQFGGNQVYSGAFASTDGVVRIFDGVLDFLCSSNTIDRDPAASAGPCVETAKATTAPTRFGVKSNLLFNETATSSMIKLVDATRFQVSGNNCRATNAGATAIDAIDIQAVTVALIDAMVTGNQITAAAGTFRSAVRLLANGANVSGSVMIADNGANQIDVGVRYEAAGGSNFTGSIILQGNNNLNAVTNDFANVGGAGVIPRVGFNAGTLGANLYEGDGDPNGVVAAHIGSMYLRRDGGQATAVYYKESGTGTAGWVGIGGAPLFWGAGSTSTAATALFMAPGYIATAVAAEIKIAITRPGTIRNLRVQVAGAGTDAGAVTYTVRKNGVDTALTCALDNTATGATSDLTHSFTVAAGDLLSISILKAGIVTAGQTNVFASVELI